VEHEGQASTGTKPGCTRGDTMGEERIEDKLKRMVVTRLFMKVKPEAIDEDKSLVEVYGVDSVSLLELVVGIEEEFGVVIGDDEFDIKNFETVSALAAFVRSKTV
jgi:acyl carrier protein